MHMLWSSLRALWPSLGGSSCTLAGIVRDGEVNVMILNMGTWANSAYSVKGLDVEEMASAVFRRVVCTKDKEHN